MSSPDDDNETEGMRSRDTLVPAGTKRRILLVDDSKFSLSQVDRALGDDYEKTLANGGAEGLQKLEQGTFDLVITDLLMPHISGLAFLGQVKAKFPRTKVIVSSADIQDATAEKARALGAAAFVPKPVETEELQRIVRLVLSHTEAPAKLSVSPRYADAFKEIFNIGMGRAAKALSKMVYETVKLSVPRLEVIAQSELQETVAANFSDELALVRQDFSGSAAGSAFLLMSKESGLRLVNALVHKDENEDVEFRPADKELLTEVGNILINALVGSMANTLGINFDLAQADCDVGNLKKVNEHFDDAVADYVLLVETLFLLPGRHIGGNLFIMMSSAEMGTVLQGIDRVF